jgi:gag-polyprotein putative aspartyl protease
MATRRPGDGAVTTIMLAAMLQASVAAAGEIPLTRDGGVYLAPVTIEGRLERPFIVDSGASDVQVSAELFEVLYPRGTPPPRFLAGGSYRLADGRVVSSRRFVIRSLRVGNYDFRDVSASIAEPGAPLLLGQNVLARLGAWSIDNRRSVLVLGERQAEGAGQWCLSWQTAPATCAVAAARDYFRDTRPRHDVTSLVLLRTDGDRATVLADVLRRDGRRAPVRLCGQVTLARAGTGWRVASTTTMHELGRDARCVP